MIKRRSPKCEELIKKHEGYHRALKDGRCQAYPDPGPTGLPITIGFGTTRYSPPRFGRHNVVMGDTLTRKEAEAELMHAVDECEITLGNMLGNTPITQGMFDALLSFAYNMGIGGASQQINRVIQRNYEQCAKSFDLYIKAGGMVLPGLVNRRNEEEALFRSEPFP